MNLRIGDHPIRNSSELTERDVLAFFNEKFLLDQILREYVEGSMSGACSSSTAKERGGANSLFFTLCSGNHQGPENQRGGHGRDPRALEHLKRNLPGAAILGLVNKEMGILSEEDFEGRFARILEKKIGQKKGKEIIGSNLALLKYGASLASTNGAGAAANGSAESAVARSGAFSGNCPSYKMAPPEDFGQGPGTAGLPVGITDKDDLGAIKPVNLIENYQETFYNEMVKPISEGRKVPWDRFLPVVPAGTSKYRDMSYIGAQLPVYDPAKCTVCGACAATCPDSALYCTVTDRPVPDGASATSRFSRSRPRESRGIASP